MLLRVGAERILDLADLEDTEPKFSCVCKQAKELKQPGQQYKRMLDGLGGIENLICAFNESPRP